MAGRRGESGISTSHQGKMVDPKHPELTPLLEMVHRKRREREVESKKKKKGSERKPTQGGDSSAAQGGDSSAAQGGAPSPQNMEIDVKTLLDSAAHMLGSTGGNEAKRNSLALFEASVRVASQKQSRMADIPRFYLPESATFHDLVKLKIGILKQYQSVQSMDVEGLAPVTPPTELDVYYIIDITRPSDTDPGKAVSVAQILMRQTDNYFCGVLPTPADPTASGVFFVFSNIILPWFFGNVHHMSCSSRYVTIANMEMNIDSIHELVEQILLLTPLNCKHISPYMISLLEIGMFLFGEFPRMQGPVELLENNFSFEPICLTSKVLFEMRNWSYLSKTGFGFYLGMLEANLNVVEWEQAFVRGWKMMNSAVIKFKKKGHKLDLIGDYGFFSLRKLVGNRLQLLKFDEEFVKRLIIRKERKHRGRMEPLKSNTANQVQSIDVDCETDSEEEAEDETPDELVKKEHEFWLSLLQDDDTDRLIKVLCELNVDQPDKIQSEDTEPASLASCASEPSSPGVGNNLSDGLAHDCALPTKEPGESTSPTSECVTASSAATASDLVSTSCSTHNCALPTKEPGESTSLTSECVTASSAASDLVSTSCSSVQCPGSDKTSVNTKRKEFKLNRSAKSFTPSASSSPAHAPATDVEYFSPNSMMFTPGPGLPVGMGFPQSYGSVPPLYNGVPMYYPPPQFPQSYGNIPPLYNGVPMYYPPPQLPQSYGSMSSVHNGLRMYYPRSQSVQPYGGAPTFYSDERGSST